MTCYTEIENSIYISNHLHIEPFKNIGNHDKDLSWIELSSLMKTPLAKREM